MLFVPLYVEGLRSRPLLVFWFATLTQALLWLITPLLFYWAPPGELPQLLAIGHEFPLNGNVGPPLAYWLAEIAFRLAGILGVYLLSQVCIVITYWCVFALGRDVVGPTHAAMALLLMPGISVFTVPTPEFGPPMLTTALWAMVLLHYWRAVAQKRRLSWYALGSAAALILLTTKAALILLGLLVLFTALSARARAAFAALEPWIVSVALLFVLVLHVVWLGGAGNSLTGAAVHLHSAGAGAANTLAWLRLFGALLVAHLGLAVLVLSANGWPRPPTSLACVTTRKPVDPFAGVFIKTFAVAPALLATIVSVLAGARQPIGGITPLLVLSGLAVVVVAGDSIALYRPRFLGWVWAGLLAAPAALVPPAIALLPWVAGIDLSIAQPSTAMGRFFGDSFERRTGHRLPIVSGDVRTAALVALSAPSRPSIFFDFDPTRSPWITVQDVREKGAIVVWPATEMNPEAPPEIRARFPDLIAEVPHTFARPVRGRLSPLLIGWGVIRPANAPAAH